jgi:hypothetical protein
MIADPHRPKATGIGWTEGSVAVGLFVPLTLTSRLRAWRRITAVEQFERDRANYEQIDGRDTGSVIAQRSLPTSRRWSTAQDHTPAYGRFSDLDPKHQQFAVDLWCAQQRVLALKAPNRRSNLRVYSWAAANVAGLPASSANRRGSRIDASGSLSRAER